MGANTIPPITLVSILTMVVCFMQPNVNSIGGRIGWPHLGDVCVSVENTLHRHQWQRILFSALFHADDMHLYFNMLSFLWKSKQLETKFGSNVYLFLLITLMITTNFLYIVINILLAEFVDYNYTYRCAVGFSGVVFALKVILAHFTPNAMSSVMGIVFVPMRYASWLELVLISILVPKASFVGHLSGILVGLLAVWFYNTFLRRRNYFYGRPERLGSTAEYGREQELRRARREAEDEKKRLEKRGKDRNTFQYNKPCGTCIIRNYLDPTNISVHK